MNGVAVHARRGDRSKYRPIKTSLCPGSDPAMVAGAMCERVHSDTLYMADLDAIQGGAPQIGVVQALIRSRPNLEVWADGGIVEAEDASIWLGLPQVTVVVGSETLPSLASWEQVQANADSTRLVLSLDFGPDGRFRGPYELLRDPSLWPDRVVVMTLARVGAEAGPDWDILADIKDRRAGRSVFAAGGVRGLDDLFRLGAIGIAGALVATAIHQKVL
jgi:phosphoribosylformimino-5-aminoimidazole carboxamide ribotide isomerase